MSGRVNRYSLLRGDELEGHFSQFLIDSWSYSAVTTFARNEKEFERRYIYREPSRSSAATVAGTAYHAALQLYFDNLANGAELSVADLQEEAYRVISVTAANGWKLGKKTPTVEAAVAESMRMVNALIGNFFSERGVYTDSLARVVAVEEEIACWMVVADTDIPLPCRMKIDLVVELADGRRVIIDHKSKASYTDRSEMAYTGAKQSIVYTIGWETLHPEMPVDEVWYMENKHSRNKDGTPQIQKSVIALDPDTRRLYEAILYEPLRRMIQATSDPDYLYTINDSDTLTDRAELYDFWARTLIADIDDFIHIPDNKRELIARRRRKVRDASAVGISPKVIRTFRKNAATFISYELRDDMTNQEKIEHTLKTFNIMARVAHTFGSFSSETYLLEIGPGVMIRNIAQHSLDIANAIDVSSVRVLPALTVYDGRSYLCVEAPRRSGGTLPWDPKYLQGTKLPLGLDNFGRTVCWDIASQSTPHILVCGATGSGKSVCIRSTIEYARLAGVERIIIMDPKYEFLNLRGGGTEVIPDIEEIEERMKWLVAEMQAKARSGAGGGMTLVVFDEFADAVSSARSGRALDLKDDDGRIIGREKSLEENLRMLLQKGRSLGYRVMAATQRASTKVITGDAKVNFPVQVCFRVPKAVDSKVVLDEEGAETLAGRGDGLLRSPEYFGTVRFQGFFKP